MRTLILLLALLITSGYVFAQQANNKPAKKQETNKTGRHLKLYPTETASYVNVYVEYERPTDFIITIVGSPLNNERKWDIKAKASYQLSVDVSQLPAGPYTITLDGGGVHEKSEFTVKR